MGDLGNKLVTPDLADDELLSCLEVTSDLYKKSFNVQYTVIMSDDLSGDP